VNASSTPNYVIRGGVQGRERLRLLSRVLWPSTRTLFERVGLPRDARCLDLGCGGGDVSVELARLAPDGSCVGIDLDEEKIEIARDEAATAAVGNVEFRVGDATARPPSGDERFDLVYARFLLTHLPDPGGALEHMRAWLAPAGAFVVEDIDFSGHFSHPDSPPFRRYQEWYCAAVRARDCDPDIGPRLPGLLADAGLQDVGVHVVQPAAMDGEITVVAPLTLENVADAIVQAQLATREQVERTIDELYEFARADGTLMSLPRIVQAWGRRGPFGTIGEHG
jgi:ubiquinone/menaquinone biosynthesis C-methylase UbiE